MLCTKPKYQYFVSLVSANSYLTKIWQSVTIAFFSFYFWHTPVCSGGSLGSGNPETWVPAFGTPVVDDAVIDKSLVLLAN